MVRFGKEKLSSAAAGRLVLIKQSVMPRALCVSFEGRSVWL